MDKPEALRLADALTHPTYPDWVMHTVPWRPPAQAVCEAAVELRRQHGEIKSMRTERLRSERRLSAVEAQRDALLEVLKEITPSICHVSIVPEEKCAQCGRIARARAAIKAVEEKA